MRVHTELNFKGVFTPGVNVDTRVGALRRNTLIRITHQASVPVLTLVSKFKCVLVQSKMSLLASMMSLGLLLSNKLKQFN